MEKTNFNIKLTKTDWLIEILASCGLIFLWVLLILNYYKLPEIIPTHFNAIGKVDKHGNKINLIMLVVVATILFAALTFIIKSPQNLKNISAMSTRNNLKHYQIAMRTMRFVKLTIIIIFSLILYKTLENINGQNDGLGIWFLPFLLLITFIPIAYSLIKTRKLD